MRAFGQTAKWKKEEGKTLAIKKGAFWPIARLQQLAKEGKEKKAPKRGARRPDYFDRHHRAGGVQRRLRRHRVTWLSSLLFHARFLVKLCVESNVTNDPCHRIFFAHKRQTICGTCYSHPPGQIRAVQPVCTGRADGQLGCWAAMLQLNSPISFRFLQSMCNSRCDF